MKRGRGITHKREGLCVGLLLSLLYLQCQQQSLAHGRTQCGLTAGEVGAGRAHRTLEGQQDGAAREAGDKPRARQPDSSASRSDLWPQGSRRIKALGIRLPMQGTPVRSLVREPRSHKLQGKEAQTLQLPSLCSRARAPQLEEALAETRGLLAVTESQHSQKENREDTVQ